MFRYSKNDGFNPNLSNYFTEAGKDALGILAGLNSSTFNVASLLTVDAPEFARRVIKNRVPLTLIHALIDRIPGKDYNRPGADPDAPVVFFRHGYWTGAASMKGFGKTLGKDFGIDNHQYDYTDYLPDLADRFLNKVEKVKAAGKEVHVIAHSKGALVALYAYQQKPELFDKIVTMAVPFQGSEMADKYWWVTLPFPPYISLREFSPNNLILSKMKRKGLPENAQIINFYTDTDKFIKPFENAKLPEQDNVNNILIPGIRHNAFLYDAIVQQFARFFLNDFPFDDRLFDRVDLQLHGKETARLEEIILVN